MMKKMLWLPLFILSLAGTAFAQQQTVSITASDPVDGSTAVATETNISFTFDHPIDATRFYDIFEIHPVDSVDVDLGAGVLSADGMTVTFSVVQRPNTDISWITFGANYHDSATGDPIFVAPNVLHYTTAASLASSAVSGTLTFSGSAGKQASQIAAWPRQDRVNPVHAFSQARPRTPDAPVVKMEKGTVGRFIKSMRKEASSVLDASGSVVVLSRCNIFDCTSGTSSDGDFSFSAGTVVVDPSGTYSIPYVGDGQYYLFAVKFAARGTDFNDDESFPDYLGFYDADGDGVPDPIDVAGADVSGVDAVLFPISAFGATAGEVAAAAQAEADFFAPDQQLLSIFGGPLEDNGTTASGWVFLYYSATNQMLTVSVVSPFDEFAFAQEYDPGDDFLAPLPEVWVDSDVAVGAALANGGADFMALHPGAVISTLAGDPEPVGDGAPVALATLPGDAYWFVFMSDESSPDPAFRITLVDMVTGDVAASVGNDSDVTGLSLIDPAQALVDGLGLGTDFAPIALGTPAANEGGRAIPWGLRFHSPSAAIDVEVGALGPDFMVYRVIDDPLDVIDAPAIPADAMDTDATMAIALEAGGAAFLAQFGPDAEIAMLGGQSATSEAGDATGAVYLTHFAYNPPMDPNGDGMIPIGMGANYTLITDMVSGQVLFRYADGFDLPPLEGDITLVASSPVNDEVLVGETTTVSFTFDQPINPWEVGKLIEAHPSSDIEYNPDDFILSDDGRTLSYTVTHLKPDSDYLWVSFGGRYFDEFAAAGKTIHPFVVRYTMAPALGTGSVSGTVIAAAPAKQGTTVTPGRVQAGVPFARRAYENIKPNVTLKADDLTLLKETMNTARTEVAAKGASTVTGTAESVVVLLDCNVFVDGGCDGIDGRNGDIQAASIVPDDSGAFTVSGVQDGTYWPAAAQFLNDSGTDPNSANPATLGFYDADGDGVADPVDVVGGEVAGISITLYNVYDLLAFTAEEGQARADAAAAESAADQELFGVQGLSMNDGRALAWQYAYRSTSTSQITIVEVGPFDTNADVIPVDLNGPFFVPGAIPPGYADSDVVVQSGLDNGGADFLAGYEYTVTVAAAGAFFDVRDLPLPADALRGPHWFVVFLGVNGFNDEPDFLITVFDMDGNFVGKLSRSDAWAMAQRRDRALQVLQAIEGGEVRLVGIVSPKISIDGLSGGWQMAFYVPATDQLAIISLLGDEVTDVEIFDNAGLSDVPEFDAGIIDSPQALAAALAAGGDAFLADHPNATIRLAAGYFLQGDVLGFAPYGVIAIIIADDPEAGDDPFPAGKTVGTTVPGFTAVIDAVTGDVLASEVGEVATAIEEGTGVQTPTLFKLDQSYPNPVADRAVIPFDVPRTAPVEIQVFDILGRRVMSLSERQFGAGHHEVTLDVSSLPNGAYFYQVRSGKDKKTRLLTVIR